jgi:HlyD family secretion protein
VSANSVLVNMSSESAADQYKNGVLSLRDAQLSYESTQKELDNYNIKAPIVGTIIEKTAKAGDIIDSSSSSQTILTVIADMSTMVFEINVDELDIAKMKEGQKVNITADALPDSTFTGYVDNVGINGITQDGVTSYPVKIVIDRPEGLLPGMNVNADIVVESASNVLTIPVTAVNRGNIVFVKGVESRSVQGGPTSDDTKTKQGTARPNITRDMPTGYGPAIVELGISDDSFIEVTSGLKDGDMILVPVELASTSAGTNNQTAMPGLGGDMPMGERPSGGGPPHTD